MMLSYYNQYIAEQADLSEAKISQCYEGWTISIYSRIYQFTLDVKMMRRRMKEEALKTQDDAQAARNVKKNSFVNAVKNMYRAAEKLTKTPILSSKGAQQQSRSVGRSSQACELDDAIMRVNNNSSFIRREAISSVRSSVHIFYEDPLTDSNRRSVLKV